MSSPVSAVQNYTTQPAFAAHKAKRATSVAFGALTDTVRFGKASTKAEPNEPGIFDKVVRFFVNIGRWFGRLFNDKPGETYAKYKDDYLYKNDVHEKLTERNADNDNLYDTTAIGKMAATLIKNLHQGEDKTGLNADQIKNLFLDEGVPKDLGDLTPIFNTLAQKAGVKVQSAPQPETPKKEEQQDTPTVVTGTTEDQSKTTGNDDKEKARQESKEAHSQLLILQNKSRLSGPKKTATTKTLLVKDKRTSQERDTLKGILPFYSNLTSKEKHQLKGLAAETTLEGEKLASWKQLIQKARLSEDELKQMDNLKEKVAASRTKPEPQAPEQTIFIINGQPVEIKRKQTNTAPNEKAKETQVFHPFKGYQYHANFALNENGQPKESVLQFTLVPPQPQTKAPSAEESKALNNLFNQINAVSLQKVITKYFSSESSKVKQQLMADLAQVTLIMKQSSANLTSDEIGNATIIGKILTNKNLNKAERELLVQTYENKDKTFEAIIRSHLEMMINTLKSET